MCLCPKCHDLDNESGYTVTAKPLKKGRSLVNSGFVRDMQDSLGPVYEFVRISFRTDILNCFRAS